MSRPSGYRVLLVIGRGRIASSRHSEHRSKGICSSRRMVPRARSAPASSPWSSRGPSNRRRPRSRRSIATRTKVVPTTRWRPGSCGERVERPAAERRAAPGTRFRLLAGQRTDTPPRHRRPRRPRARKESKSRTWACTVARSSAWSAASSSGSASQSSSQMRMQSAANHTSVSISGRRASSSARQNGTAKAVIGFLAKAIQDRQVSMTITSSSRHPYGKCTGSTRKGSQHCDQHGTGTKGSHQRRHGSAPHEQSGCRVEAQLPASHSTALGNDTGRTSAFPCSCQGERRPARIPGSEVST